MSDPYHPIDCGLHDELQLRVLRRRAVELAWRDSRGTTMRREAVLQDVFSRDAAEYVRLDDGTEVRLDRLVTVDGLAFDPLACGTSRPSAS